jgi:hypothetical protein
LNKERRHPAGEFFSFQSNLDKSVSGFEGCELIWTAVASEARHRFSQRASDWETPLHPKAPSPLALCRRSPKTATIYLKTL